MGGSDRHIMVDNDYIISTSPILEVAPNWFAVNGRKVYEFDPKTATLKLNADKFVEGELERRIGIEDAKQYVVNVDLLIPEYGSRRIEGVRNIQYVPATKMKVEYPQETPMLSEIIGRIKSKILSLAKK